MQTHDQIVMANTPGDATEAGAASTVLAFRNIGKTFGPTVAVDDVSFELHAGEIHALVGENGAGKSTLIRILAGDHQPDQGQILLDGKPVQFGHPGAALEHGIGFVHQIPMYVPDLSITENLLLGVPFRRNGLGLIDWAAEHIAAKKDLLKVGIHADPRQPLINLGPAERQLVAVARSLRRGLSVLVLDEVTASLTELEVRTVHTQIKHLRDQGIAILYVSHRLEEIFRIADRVTVMRDGRRVATLPVAGISHRDLVNHIVGSDVDDLFSKPNASPTHAGSSPRLELAGLGDAKLKGLDLKLYPGEIVGIAGLGGSGRSRLLKTIYGEVKHTEGEIRLDGKVCRFASASDALDAGIGLVTEDRIADGFVDTLPIWKNITLPWAKRYSGRGFLKLGHERTSASRDAARVAVKMPSVDALMTQLSGGNQQKAIFARWISAPIKLLLLDEPTHGVDIRSKSHIYELIRDLTKRGVSILLVSSDTEELVGLSDRVFILSSGHFRSELSGDEINKDRILHSLLDEEEQS
ncbi:sugar ABC transporter ATP-binding protein [Mesorhizobium sp. A556]